MSSAAGQKWWRINPLFVLLLTSATLLWLAFPEIKQDILNQNQEREILDDPLPLIHIPDQATVNTDSIYCYNPALELLYSLDGGANYTTAKNGVLKLDNLANTPNIYQSTSIRWRHPNGCFPVGLSLVLKIKNPDKNTVTHPVKVQYPPAEQSLPVMMISISNDELFDYQKGLMIDGASANQDDGFQKDWWFRSANFSNRAYAWKRPAFCTYYDNNQKPFNFNANMAISGNATRYFPQKSLKFYLTNETGRKDSKKVPFWKNGNKKARSFVLRNSGNDNMNTLFADLLAHDLATETNVLVQKGQPVHGYINGNFWGIYNLRERVDAYFIAKREDVKRKEVTLLVCENFGDRLILKTGSETVKKEFESIIETIQEGKLKGDSLYDYLRKDLSIKSFIDYVLWESFFANNDWPHNNVTLYKAGDKDWKWVLNDLDYSMAYPGANNVHYNQFEKIQNSYSIVGFLYNALMMQEKFREKLKDRGLELLEHQLSEERIQEVYGLRYQQYEPVIEQHIKRWRFISSFESWQADCQANVNFLLKRRKIFQEQLNQL